jgi:hypothetical protein
VWRAFFDVGGRGRRVGVEVEVGGYST